MNSSVENKLKAFFSQFDSRTFEKGDVIIRADENPLQHIYYIESGYIRQYSLSADGEEKAIMLFKAGTYIPTVYVLNGHLPNHYFFEATSRVVTRRAPKEAVITFLHNNPEVLFDLTTRLSRGLETMSSMLENIMSTCARCKVVVVFLVFSRRFGKRTGMSVEITMPLTHKEVGSFAGVTRETVSRELQKLIDQKYLIKKENLYTIADLSKFEKLLST
ncbi:MAG: Crp/Fnr family transcriptional regulator [Patescibacteria group bacterium]|jgi:CRP-like cAMP-binding protein